MVIGVQVFKTRGRNIEQHFTQDFRQVLYLNYELYSFFQLLLRLFQVTAVSEELLDKILCLVACINQNIFRGLKF